LPVGPALLPSGCAPGRGPLGSCSPLRGLQPRCAGHTWAASRISPGCCCSGPWRRGWLAGRWATLLGHTLRSPVLTPELLERTASCSQPLSKVSGCWIAAADWESGKPAADCRCGRRARCTNSRWAEGLATAARNCSWLAPAAGVRCLIAALGPNRAEPRQLAAGRREGHQTLSISALMPAEPVVSGGARGVDAFLALGSPPRVTSPGALRPSCMLGPGDRPQADRPVGVCCAARANPAHGKQEQVWWCC